MIMGVFFQLIKVSSDMCVDLRGETAKSAERVNEATRITETLKCELAAARSSESLLQSLLQDARDYGAAREEEQRKRTADAEAVLAALKLEHAQLQGKMATSLAEEERLKAQVASLSKDLPELKAQLHEAVCCNGELQGRLQAAEEEIAAFGTRIRAELEQKLGKAAEMKLEAMEEKMHEVTALEEQSATLSEELTDSRNKLEVFEKAAAKERQTHQRELKWQQFSAQRLDAKCSWHLVAQISCHWRMFHERLRGEKRVLAKQVRRACYNVLQIWRSYCIHERRVQSIQAKRRRFTCREAWQHWREHDLKLKHLGRFASKCKRKMSARMWCRWRRAQEIERNVWKLLSKCKRSSRLKILSSWKERHRQEKISSHYVVRVTRMAAKYYRHVQFEAWCEWKSFHSLAQQVRRVAARVAARLCQEAWHMWICKQKVKRWIYNRKVTLQVCQIDNVERYFYV
jgi:hypothetical protein